MAERAIDLFHQINDPDEVNFLILFNACAQLKTKEALDIAKTVAKQVPQLNYSNPRLSSSLLDVYTKCGDIPSAETLFANMVEKSSENYGVLMNAYNNENNFDKTLKLFYRMKLDSIQPDLFNYLHVIKALSRIGAYSFSQSIIKEIPQSILLDKQIQTALVDMWVR